MLDLAGNSCKPEEEVAMKLVAWYVWLQAALVLCILDTTGLGGNKD